MRFGCVRFVSVKKNNLPKTGLTALQWDQVFTDDFILAIFT